MIFRKKLPTALKADLDSFIQIAYEPTAEAFVTEDAVFGGAALTPKARAIGKAKYSEERAVYRETAAPPPYAAPMQAAAPQSLSDALRNMDESFQEMLLRKIDEKDMKDSECYKRAGVDRKLFSKIRSNPQYKPKKTTAIAFCIALELPYNESVEMLRKAGYALSRSSKFDVIVEYFLRNRRYSIHELNCALYEYDQQIIG